MGKYLILVFLFRFGLKHLLSQGGERTNNRLTSCFICVEEVSQHTSCHGDAEEREAELAAELYPQHRPHGHKQLSLRTCPVAKGTSEGCSPPHPCRGALYSCTSLLSVLLLLRGDTFVQLLKNAHYLEAVRIARARFTQAEFVL